MTDQHDGEQPETREQAVQRIVAGMLAEGGKGVLTRGGIPKREVLNARLGEAFDAAVDAGLDDSDGWDEVSAKELKALLGGPSARPESKEPPAEGPPGIEAEAPAEAYYPTTYYQAGRPSLVVQDAEHAERARRQGYRSWDEHTPDEKRALHPMGGAR